MRIDVLTLFPEMLEAPLRTSLLGKAIEEGRMDVQVTDIREFARDKHRTADDEPYGGGPGMVMKCEPIFEAVESLRSVNSLERVILLSPRGRRLDQRTVEELAGHRDLVFICGRYEGVDERVSEALCTDELSIGDYVLSGGELPALVVIEAVSRRIPGVIGQWESVETDSFSQSPEGQGGVLGVPQYTRPAEYRGMEVPAVLRNGNHAAIARWRRKEAIRLTSIRRPELLDGLSESDKRLVAELREERNARHETGQANERPAGE